MEYLNSNLNIPFIPPTNPNQASNDPALGILIQVTAQSVIATVPHTTAESIRTFNFQQQEFMKNQATTAVLRSLIQNLIAD